MELGQISMADSPTAKQSLRRFEGLVKQYLASEKDLVVRWAVRSVWVAEVFYKGRDEIGVIDLSLPLELQFYQLGQQIDKLKSGTETEHSTSTESQHGREPEKLTCGDCGNFKLVSKGGQKPSLNCAIVGYGTKTDNNPCDRFEPEKVKPLAQYLDEYIEHEVGLNNIGILASDLYAYNSWRELLEQALDAYESTEQVKIRIERV